MWNSYVENIFVGRLNINSRRNKFLSLKELSQNLDLLTINETKLEDSFRIPSFKSITTKIYVQRLECLLLEVCLYINEDILSKQVHTKLVEGLESICIEMNLRKRKWLVIGIYKPRHSCRKMYIEALSNQLNNLHTNYVQSA